jgi:hypothetical protein
MVKKLVLFLLLKIAEIFVFVTMPYYIGELSGIGGDLNNVFVCWLAGAFVLVVLMVALVCMLGVIYFILRWINFNWKIVNGGKGITWIDNII